MATSQNKALITFGKKYEREWKHLQTKGNKSKYVAELIAKDLELNHGLDLCDSGIQSIKAALRDVLDEYEFGVVATKKEVAEEEFDYSDSIDDLFNL